MKKEIGKQSKPSMVWGSKKVGEPVDFVFVAAKDWRLPCLFLFSPAHAQLALLADFHSPRFTSFEVCLEAILESSLRWSNVGSVEKP